MTGELNTEGYVRGRVNGILDKDGSFRDIKCNKKGAVSAMIETDKGDSTNALAGIIYQRSRGVYDTFGVPVVGKNGEELNLNRKIW